MNKKTEVNLLASIFMKEEDGNTYPCIELSDVDGNCIIGYCTWHSVETLARQYQRDKEYRSKGKYSYYLTWKGNKSKTQLFQKAIQQNYGEPSKYIDKTDNKY